MSDLQDEYQWPDAERTLAGIGRALTRRRPAREWPPAVAAVGRLAASAWRLRRAALSVAMGLAAAWALTPRPVPPPPPAGLILLGDMLRIERRDPRSGVLTAADQVAVDGAGRIIVMGRRVAAAGRTPEELAAQLAQLYSSRQPDVPLVRVRAEHPVTVQIAGPADVCLPGPRTLPSGTRLSRLCEVLHPGRRIDAARVDLVREGHAQRYDLLEIASGAAPDDPVLQEGDRLELARRDGATRSYWLLGAVARPGRRDLVRGLPVSAALDEAEPGRPEPTVHLVRGWPEHPRILRLSPADEAIPDLALEPGDLLLVSGSERGLLGERPALAALVMALAGEEPIVMAAVASD